MGKLTTHVLDTMRGGPAANVGIELWQIDPQSRQRTLLVTTTTNADGRTDGPLLADAAFAIGCYELVFAMGQYFAQSTPKLPNPAFLDRVPIQFGIADADAHYHVPLLASPWSYSTYRGS
jgi:5-hydroxyisourate hydrolase